MCLYKKSQNPLQVFHTHKIEMIYNINSNRNHPVVFYEEKPQLFTHKPYNPMFSKPIHPEMKQKETRKVTFCLEKNTIKETYPAKYIGPKEQIYPDDLEEKAYDRRIENSKGKYRYNRNRIMLNIQKHSYSAWLDIYDKETTLYFKNKQIRKDILNSEQIMSIWKPETTAPSYNKTLKEPLSSDESSDDDNQQD